MDAGGDKFGPFAVSAPWAYCVAMCPMRHVKASPWTSFRSAIVRATPPVYR